MLAWRQLTRTLAGDAPAPLTAEVRGASMALFEMRWVGVASELTPDDWAAFQRLCLPASPDFLVDHLDYDAFFTYSMFCGRVPL